MLTDEQAASGYEQATDGYRHSLLGARDNARQWQRVKPDEELHPLAELDYEGGDVGSSLCRTLLLCERVRARDGDQAFCLQLRCGGVNVGLIQTSEFSNVNVGQRLAIRISTQNPQQLQS
jgi:hypothetical protein